MLSLIVASIVSYYGYVSWFLDVRYGEAVPISWRFDSKFAEGDVKYVNIGIGISILVTVLVGYPVQTLVSSKLGAKTTFYREHPALVSSLP